MKLLAPIALALEVRPVNGRSGLELGEFGLQHLDAGLERGGDRTVLWRPAPRRLGSAIESIGARQILARQ
jgi:hypothetical protein